MLVSCLAYSPALKNKATVPPKRRLSSSGLHGTISQKTEHFSKIWTGVFKMLKYALTHIHNGPPPHTFKYSVLGIVNENLNEKINRFTCIMNRKTHIFVKISISIIGARGSVVGWGTMLQAGR
jgi:hypothetical protein